MHCSLDGFVAGPNGEMDWIQVDDEIFDYAGDRTDHSDTALYGRVTFEMMDGYWPTAGKNPSASKHDKQHSSWYNSVEKVVMSKSMKGQRKEKVSIISEDLEKNISDLKKRPGKDILVFGSPTASHSLMALDLIDEYWLFVNPVLLGNGIPLFSQTKPNRKLKLEMSKKFDAGVICLYYTKAD